MPVKIWNAAGVLQFDSDAVTAGICLGSFYVPSGGTLSKNFPLLAGCSISAFLSWAPDDVKVRAPSEGVTYPAGVPTINIPSASFNRMFTLWATGAAAVQTGISGLQYAASASGTVALSQNGRGLNYIGVAAKYSDAAGNHPYSSGTDPAADPNYQIYRISSATQPVFVMRLYQNCIVVVRAPPVQVASGIWEIAASRLMSPISPPEAVYKRWWSYDTDIYCFAQPSAPQQNPSFFINDTDGVTLAYDLARPGLLRASHFVPAVYVDGESTLSGLPSVCGVIGTPQYYEKISTIGYYQDNTEYTSAEMRLSGWALHGAVLRKERYITMHDEFNGLPGLDQLVDYPSHTAVINLNGLV